MKFLIIHPEPTVRFQLKQWLEEQRHHVVLYDTDSWTGLLGDVSRYEPDAVLVSSTEFNPEEANFSETTDAPAIFPDCQFITIALEDCRFNNDRPTEPLRQLIEQAEEHFRDHQPVARNFADERRVVFHDERYGPFASPLRLHRPEQKEGWQKVCAEQEGKFVLQLQTATTNRNHERARRYLAIVQRFDRGFRQEIAYRISHGSYKVAWLREQVARWLTVLIHYVPDAEIEHCPPPQNASKKIVTLHYNMPLSYQYACVCAIQYGIRVPIAKQILETISWQYRGETEDELAAIACRLLGLNAYLAQVAQAQVKSMEQFLNLQSDFHRIEPSDRALHRSLGVYFEFWGWHYIHNLGPDLRQITSRFHSGQTRVERRAPLSSSFLKFRSFIETLSTADEEVEIPT